jgi:hypothetical protein
VRFPSGGPFLEFNFYWADLSERDALFRLAQALWTLGARFRRGGVSYSSESGDGVLSDRDIRDGDLANIADLEDLLTEPRVEVQRLYMEGATGTTQGVAEIITYLSITEAVSSDHRPIAIWTEGHWLESWTQETKAGEQHARTMGTRARKRFCALAETTQPSYAAITVEYPLLTPAQLRRMGPGYAFYNFYVSGAYVGQASLATIQRLYEDAYVEPLGDGLYISCSAHFNPRGKRTAEVHQKADQLARLLARGGA